MSSHWISTRSQETPRFLPPGVPGPRDRTTGPGTSVRDSGSMGPGLSKNTWTLQEGKTGGTLVQESPYVEERNDVLVLSGEMQV